MSNNNLCRKSQWNLRTHFWLKNTQLHTHNNSRLWPIKKLLDLQVQFLCSVGCRIPTSTRLQLIKTSINQVTCQGLFKLSIWQKAQTQSAASIRGVMVQTKLKWEQEIVLILQLSIGQFYKKNQKFNTIHKWSWGKSQKLQNKSNYRRSSSMSRWGQLK